VNIDLILRVKTLWIVCLDFPLRSYYHRYGSV